MVLWWMYVWGKRGDTKEGAVLPGRANWKSSNHGSESWCHQEDAGWVQVEEVADGSWLEHTEKLQGKCNFPLTHKANRLYKTWPPYDKSIFPRHALNEANLMFQEEFQNV